MLSTMKESSKDRLNERMNERSKKKGGNIIIINVLCSCFGDFEFTNAESAVCTDMPSDDIKGACVLFMRLCPCVQRDAFFLDG